MTVAVDPRKTLSGGYPSLTWAQASPMAAALSGLTVFVSDLGANGTLMRSNGTRWRAVSGANILKDAGAPVSGIANTPTKVMETLLPAGSWQTLDTLRLWLATSKSGTTDVLVLSVRIGTAGTGADTAITGLSAAPLLGATTLAGEVIYDIRLESATSARRIGSSNTGTGSVSVNNQALAAATTITDASANALYVTAWISSSGTTNTVQIDGGQIQLITP